MSLDQRGSDGDDRRARLDRRDRLVHQPDRPDTSAVSDDALTEDARLRHAATVRTTDPGMRAATLPPAGQARAGSDGARPTQHRSDRKGRGAGRE